MRALTNQIADIFPPNDNNIYLVRKLISLLYLLQIYNINKIRCYVSCKDS